MLELSHIPMHHPHAHHSDTLCELLLDDLLGDTVLLLNREERAAQIEAAAADEGAQLACAAAALDAYASEMDEARAVLMSQQQQSQQQSQQQMGGLRSQHGNAEAETAAVSAQPAPVVWHSQPHATATTAAPAILPSAAVHPTVDRTLFVPMAAAAVNQNVSSASAGVSALASTPSQSSFSLAQTRSAVQAQPQQPFLLALPLPRGDAGSGRDRQQYHPAQSQSQSQSQAHSQAHSQPPCSRPPRRPLSAADALELHAAVCETRDEWVAHSARNGDGVGDADEITQFAERYADSVGHEFLQYGAHFSAFL
jgi:hypothetical protein